MTDQVNATYKKDGLIYTLPGIEYQVKLSMLLFKRALNMGCKFRIAAEREGAGKFDDLEIEILDSKIHRLYQLKHLENETNNRITTGELENMKDGKFSLMKYFASYRQIKATEAASGMSYEFFIFTNIGMERKLRENFEDTGKDKLLDMKEDKKKSELLKLKKVCNYRDTLMKFLKNSSDLEQIKFKLIDCIEKGKDIDFKDKVLKKYQDVLFEQVFDEGNKQFKREFIDENSNLTGGAKELHSFLLEKFGDEIREKKLNFNSRIDLQKLGSKTKSEFTDLPNDKIDDEEINEFLDKLTLAVNQPNETELDAIIEKTMGEDKDINLLDNKLVAKEMLDQMMQWTKKKEGSYLTQDEGRDMFKFAKQMISKLALIGPTRDFCEKLNSFGISFRNTPAELDFFFKSSDKQIFCLKNICKSVFSSIKVHQTLKTLKKYDKDDSYIFSPLKNLQRIRKKVLEAFETSDLLIIEFSSSSDEMSEIFASDLFEILCRKKQKKIVLILNGANYLPKDFDDNVLAIVDDSNSFHDLSEEAQETLLSTKKVLFQGYPSLIDRDLTHLINADILCKIISDDNLEIGRKLPDLGEVENYYVPRKLETIQISDSILQAKEFSVTRYGGVIKDMPDKDIILISNDGCEFGNVCNQFKNRNVHWIQHNYNKYFWQKTQGSSISKLRKYIVHTGHCYEIETDLRISETNVVIISASPGMGKSTELTKLAKRFKASNPTYWVLRANLVDCSNMFANQSKPFDQTESINFLHKLLSATKEENIRLLEKEWFHQCLEQGKLILLFDGFDEISPNYNVKVIELLKSLKETKVKQLWITTRPYGICIELEDALLTLPHSLLPLEQIDTTNILINVLKVSLDLDQAKEYAQNLINRFSKSFNDQKGEFFENPLQVRMIATVFLDAVRSNDVSIQNKYLTGTSGDIDLAELYRKFFEILFDEYIKEKKRGLYDHKYETYAIKIIEDDRKKVEESYKIMAMYTLFGRKEFERLLPGEFERLQSEIKEIDAGSHKMGIVEKVIDDKPIFIHRTFAEYFAALCLCTESIWSNPHFKNFMKKRVFANRDMIISQFFIFLMSKNKDYQKGYPIHAAVFCNNESKLEKLLTNAKDVNAKDTVLGLSPLQCACCCEFWVLVELFLLKGGDRKFVYAIIRNLHNIQNVVNTAISKNLLIIVKIIKDLQDETNYSRFSLELYLGLCIENDSLDVMKYLMDKYEIFNIDVHENYRNSQEEKVFFAAVAKGALKIVIYLLKKSKVTVNIKDDNGRTPLLVAVENSVLNIVEYLTTLDDVDFKIRNEHDQTLLQIAVQNDSLDIVKCLINTGKFDLEVTDTMKESIVVVKEYVENKTQVSLNTQKDCLLLTAKSVVEEDIEYLIKLSGLESDEIDENGQTLLHFAIHNGNSGFEKSCLGLEVVRYLVEETKIDVNKQDRYRKTVLHLAIERENQEIAEYLVKLPEVAKNIQDDEGQTALHLAIKAGQLNIVRCLMNETSVDLSLKNKNGETPLHLAVSSGQLDIVGHLVKIKIIVNIRNAIGQTALHLVIERKNQEIAEYLIKLPEVSKNIQDDEGQTALHLAVKTGQMNIVICLINDTSVDFNVKNKNGQTPLHLAVGLLDVVSHFVNEKRKLEIAEYLIKLPEVEKNIQDNEGHTALHLAVKAGQLNIVTGLINNNFTDADLKNKYKESVLHLALKYDKFEIFQYLVGTKFVRHLEKNGEEYLQCACKSKSGLQFVQYLIEEVNVTTNTNELIHSALDSGSRETVLYFIAKGKFEKTARDKNGRTLLHSVVLKCCNVDIVKLLIEYKIEVNMQDENGQTALHLASENGKLEVTKYLIMLPEVEKNIQDKNGHSALHLAAKAGQLDIVQCLMNNATIDINLKNRDEQTPLHLATLSGRLDLVEYLIKTNKFVIICDNSGATLLHLAVRSTSVETFEYLLTTEKIDKHARNNDGQTILHYATLSNSTSILDLLIETGEFEVNAQDKNGMTALHLAVIYENLRVVSLLVKATNIDKNILNKNMQTACDVAKDNDMKDIVSFLNGNFNMHSSTLMTNTPPKKWFERTMDIIARKYSETFRYRKGL